VQHCDGNNFVLPPPLLDIHQTKLTQFLRPNQKASSFFLPRTLQTKSKHITPNLETPQQNLQHNPREPHGRTH